MSDKGTNSAREALRTGLLALGFHVVRFARIEGPAPGAEALTRWLAAGMEGGMAWMARNAEKRCQPTLVLPGARTMLVLGVNHHTAPGVAGIARHALYSDYHDTMKPGLEAAGRLLETQLGLEGEDYRYYVDTGPVLERSWAEKAGLGFTGKNAMLISRDYGNWLSLATILIRCEVDPDPPLRVAKQGPGSLCGSCTRCLNACPTRAIIADGVVDARRCLSYLTIENKGPIPEEFRHALGTRVYGCDICAEICPWNRFARDSKSILLEPRLELASLGLAELLRLTPASFAELFRGTPIKRIKLAGLLRNACVAAGNSGDKSLLPELRNLSAHDNPLVSEHARWAVAKLEAQAG